MSRKTYWVYADVSCAAYLLKDVDTIGDDGKMNELSALHLVVNGVKDIFSNNYFFLSHFFKKQILTKYFFKESEEHLKMIDGYLYDLLTKKWNNFVKFRFYFFTVLYIREHTFDTVSRTVYTVPFRITSDHPETESCKSS